MSMFQILFLKNKKYNIKHSVTVDRINIVSYFELIYYIRDAINMQKIINVIGLVLIVSSVVAAQPLAEEEKISQLISFLETHGEWKFIRNGTEYSAQEAADHLRLKRKKAGARLTTARQFISAVASSSYITKTPYRIKYPNGRIRPASEVLTEELVRIESENK